MTVQQQISWGGGGGGRSHNESGCGINLFFYPPLGIKQLLSY